MDHNAFIEHSRYERIHWWFVARHRIIDEVSSCLLGGQNRQPSVIEIGCGTGALVDQLSSKWDVRGADISSHAIDIARSHFPERRYQVYRQIEELSEPIARADLVLLLDVLEHVEDDFELFSRIANLMTPGSLLLITVPADEHLWSTHDEALFHYRRYAPERLSKLWQGLPLTPRLFSGLNWRLAPLIRTIRKGKQYLPRLDGGSTKVYSDLRPLPTLLNRSLTGIFSSESRQLKGLVDQPINRIPHRLGISLIVALQRGPGKITPRKRPAECPPDQHRPAAIAWGNHESTPCAKDP